MVAWEPIEFEITGEEHQYVVPPGDGCFRVGDCTRPAALRIVDDDSCVLDMSSRPVVEFARGLLTGVLL